jgi:outer membrane usher protein
MGYHVAASAGQDNTLDAGVVAQNEVGLYSADLRSSEFGGRVWQLNATGSIAHLDGMTSFTRQIRNAFAVVNVGDFEGVRVYSDNREMGRTNHNGQLFIPRLTPYIKNTLRIEVQDLPLNASIDSLDKITAPYFRSGVVVNFGVRISRNVMLRAIMPDGGPVPEGSTATIQGTHDTFPVGLDGRLYLQGIDRSSRVAIRWYGTICDMTVPEIEGDAVIPRLGDVVCEPRNLQ